eukprot:720153-Heterocapsa_arctica.AAC.1
MSVRSHIRSRETNSGSNIDASQSRQPLVKGEVLVRYEVNAVIPDSICFAYLGSCRVWPRREAVA